MTFKPDPLQTHAKTHNRLSPKRKGGVGELDIPIQKFKRTKLYRHGWRLSFQTERSFFLSSFFFVFFFAFDLEVEEIFKIPWLILFINRIKSAESLVIFSL